MEKRRLSGTLPAAIHGPKAFRAVGNANSRNPISIIIPCHRVVWARGDLVGYGGGLWGRECFLGMRRNTEPCLTSARSTGEKENDGVSTREMGINDGMDPVASDSWIR